METNQYEKSYRDARERLALRGKNVGKPTYRDGVRCCPVEGLLMTDRDIFVEAWSEEVAETILQERNTINSSSDSSTSSSLSCLECEELCLLYSLSNETYLEILRLKVEISSSGLLSKELLEALRQKRDAALQALITHEKNHEGKTMNGGSCPF